MSEYFDFERSEIGVESTPRAEYFEIESSNTQLLALTGNLIEVPAPVVEIIEAAVTETLVIESPQVELFERAIQGPPGAKGEPADTNILQAAVAGNQTQIIDRAPVIGFWAAQWLVTAEDDTGARRSLIVDATLNSADVDVVKYGNRGDPVAFVTRVIIDGSDVALVVENRSASDLNFRIIRLETRF